MTGPILDTISFRLSGSLSQDIHYWKPYDAHTWDLATALKWQLHERLSVSVRFETFHKRETPPVMQKPGYGAQHGLAPTAEDPNRSGVDVPGLPDDWNSMAFSDWRNSDATLFSSWLDLSIGDHWNGRLAFAHQDYQVGMLFTGNLGMSDNHTLLQGRRVRQQTYANRDDTVELQAVGRYRIEHTSLRLLVGAQYIDRSFDNHASQAPNDPALGSSPIASPLPRWDLADPTTWDRTARVPAHLLTESPRAMHLLNVDLSVYGGVTFGFADDRLLLLGGWRLTRSTTDVTDELTGLTAPTLAASAVTPQLGALVRITPELSLFGSWAESFVPGTQRLNNVDGSTSDPVPTRGGGFDVGVKARWWGGRLTGSASAFDLRNSNIINDTAVTDAQGVVRIFNAQSGEQRSTGFELDATLTPLPGWQLVASYSFMHARVVEFTGRDAALLAVDPSTLGAADQLNYRDALRFHQAPLQMSAPHLANLWTSYRLPESLGPAWHGLSLAGGVNLVVDQTLLSDSPPESRQTYALVNASVGYEFLWQGKRLSLEVLGKNLAGQQYRPSQSTRARPREVLTLQVRL